MTTAANTQELNKSLDAADAGLSVLAIALDKLVDYFNRRKLRKVEGQLLKIEQQIPKQEREIAKINRHASDLEQRIRDLSAKPGISFLDIISVGFTYFCKNGWREMLLSRAQSAQQKAQSKIGQLNSKLRQIENTRDRLIVQVETYQHQLQNQKDISLFAKLLRWLRTAVSALMSAISIAVGNALGAMANLVDFCVSIRRVQTS